MSKLIYLSSPKFINSSVELANSPTYSRARDVFIIESQNFLRKDKLELAKHGAVFSYAKDLQTGSFLESISKNFPLSSLILLLHQPTELSHLLSVFRPLKLPCVIFSSANFNGHYRTLHTPFGSPDMLLVDPDAVGYLNEMGRSATFTTYESYVSSILGRLTDADFLDAFQNQDHEIQLLAQRWARKYERYPVIPPKQLSCKKNNSVSNNGGIITAAIVCLNAPFGSAGTMGTYGLASELNKHCNLYVISDTIPDSVVFISSEIQVLEIPGLLNLSAQEIQCVYEKILEIGPSICHLIGHKSTELLFGLGSNCKNLGKVVLDIRSPIVSTNPDNIEKARRRLDYSQFYIDHLFCHCAGTFDHDMPAFSVDTTILPPGHMATETALCRYLSKRSQSTPNSPVSAVFIGSLAKSRKLTNLIDLFISTAKRSQRTITLDIFGGGDHETELRAYVLEFKAEHIVRFMGQVSSESIVDAISSYSIGIAYVPNNAHFGVAPSLKTIDYMLAGLPIVAIPTSGHRTFARDYDIEIEYFSDSESLLAVLSNNSFLSPSESRSKSYFQALKELSYASLVRNHIMPTYSQLTCSEGAVSANEGEPSSA